MKDGYYWVIRHMGWGYEICELDHGIFYFINDDDAYEIDDIFIIGDYIETPDKYK